MTLTLRLARTEDADALLALEHGAFAGDRLSRRSFRRLSSTSTAHLILAEVNDRPAGYVLVLFRVGVASARLYSIAVSPAFSGSGVGGRLLDAAEAEASRRGHSAMRLEVREDNEVALGWYRRRGYRELARLDGYYADGTAGLRLERALATPGGRNRLA